MANRYFEVLDFVNMHYCLTRRTDTEFWREVQQPRRINDRLAAKLEFWRQKPVAHVDFEDQYLPGQPETPAPGHGDTRPPIDTGKLFTRSSYEAVMYGMDFMREEYSARFGPELPRTPVPQRILERLRLARDKLPKHDAWLQQMVGMPDYPTTPS